MATQDDVINHLRALSRYKERPLCGDDGVPYYADDGNCDDTYQRGIEDGEINLAQKLIHVLDNGGALPDLPIPDDE